MTADRPRADGGAGIKRLFRHPLCDYTQATSNSWKGEQKSMVLQYKCPDCGADMEFNSQTGKLACPQCCRELDIEKRNAPGWNEGDVVPPTKEDQAQDINEDLGEYEEFESKNESGAFGEGEAVSYACENCGAEIITTSDTVATRCSFCGAPVVLGDRIDGSLAPNRVLPFTISKEQAQEAFKKWCKKGLLSPKGFMNADRIKNITGIYVPFWLFDVNSQGELHATATRVRHYSDSTYNYTETKWYDVYRRFDVNYNLIPADASEKMDDAIMDKMEPFPYQNLKPFSAPYLSGYVAEKYNYTDQQLFPRIRPRAEKYTTEFVRNDIKGYTSVHIEQNHMNIRPRRTEYVMLPIWTVCYDYKNTEHNFAMNGQTGKIAGKPPISKGKVAGFFFGISIGVFAVIKLLIMLIAGGGFFS